MDFQRTMDVMTEIENERRRQVTHEGWSTAHDDEHCNGEMAKAGAVYAWFASLPEKRREIIMAAAENGDDAAIYRRLWPWERGWFKPGTARRMLIKAAALLVAEIERIDRTSALTARKGGSDG